MAGTRRLVAIMFTDMVGFTSAARRDEAAALALLREQESLVRPIVREFGGREVKSTGDGALIELPSALRAIACAVAVQTRLHERNAAPGAHPLLLRIGVHVGDVELRDDDIFGDAVNLAARVLSVADPGGVALTEQVADHLHNKFDLPVENLGARGLKGVDRPIPIYRVVFPWSAPADVVATTAHPRLAVLPLRNISPDPRDAYFADGLTDELISALGQVRELRVIARSSASRFQGTDRPLPEIGKELGATAVLEGSVRKHGDRLRISLHLIDVASEEGLWTQTFERQLDDVFAVQAEVGERTAAALRVHILGAGRAPLHVPPTTNLAAYGLYLQGLHRLHAHRPEDIAAAESAFRQATAADPRFAAPLAQLANLLLGSIGESRPAREVVPEVRPLITNALALDPESVEARTARGNLALQSDLEWATAEAEFRRAIALNPSSPDPRRWYSLLLRALQRYADAEVQCRTLLELDPLGYGGPSMLASVLRLAGNFDEANEVIRRLFPSMVGVAYMHMSLAYSHLYAGREQDARRELEATATASGDQVVGQDADVLRARLGDPSAARARLEAEERRAETEYVPLIARAILAASVGERERAIGYLERDAREGDRGLWFTYQGLGFDPIRQDPRFVRLLERMKLPTSTPFYRGGRVP